MRSRSNWSVGHLLLSRVVHIVPGKVITSMVLNCEMTKKFKGFLCIHPCDHTVILNPLYALLSQHILMMMIVCIFVIHNLLLQKKPWSFAAWRNNWQIHMYNGKVNLQLANDSLLALKHMSSRTMLSKEPANELAMLLPFSLSDPLRSN